MSYTIKVAGDGDYENLARLSAYAFPSLIPEQGDMLDYIMRYLSGGNFLCCYDPDGHLIAQLARERFEILLSGRPVPAHFISFVASSPEGRGAGAVDGLMSAAMDLALDDGAPLLLLEPFSAAYYKRLGFAIVYESETHALPIPALEGQKGGGVIKEYRGDTRDMARIYDAAAARYNGVKLRERADFEAVVDFFPQVFGTRHTVVYYEPSGAPGGYMVYSFEGSGKREFKAHELVYADVGALRGLLGFVYSHRGNMDIFTWRAPAGTRLCHILNEAMRPCALKPYAMARVLDVERAAELSGLSHDGNVTVRINDRQLPRNDGVFTITEDGCIRTPGAIPDASMDISVFSQLLFGFMSPDELAALGALECGAEGLTKLDGAFAKRPTWNYDF